MDEWDKYMNDFEPEDMLTIQIASRQVETFYEYISTVPSKIRGAWYIGSGDKKIIDFWVVHPNGQVSHKTEGRNEGIFYFEAEEIGTYSFVFSNQRVSFLMLVLGSKRSHICDSFWESHRRSCNSRAFRPFTSKSSKITQKS